MAAARDTIRLRLALRARRITQGLTMAQVGERMGVTGQQIGRYEDGSNLPSISRLCRWAEVLGLRLTLSEKQADERATFEHGGSRNDGAAPAQP